MTMDGKRNQNEDNSRYDPLEACELKTTMYASFYHFLIGVSSFFLNTQNITCITNV